jgi:hypothetical protein
VAQSIVAYVDAALDDARQGEFTDRTYGLGYVMTGIAVMMAIAAVAVTQIGSETRGRALDEIAPPTG